MKTKIDNLDVNLSNVHSRLTPYFRGKCEFESIVKTYHYCRGVITLHVLDDGCAFIEYANTGKMVLYAFKNEAFSDAKASASRAWRIERCFN